MREPSRRDGLFERLREVAPPPGARERILAAVEAPRRRLRWMPRVATAAMAAAVVVVAMESDGGAPAATQAPAVAPAPAPAPVETVPRALAKAEAPAAVEAPDEIDMTALVFEADDAPRAAVPPELSLHRRSAGEFAAAAERAIVDVEVFERREPSELAMQVAAYEQARRAAPDVALRQLRALAVQWPGSPLAHEVDLAILDALVRLERRDDARAQAERFLRRYPGSAKAAEVREVLR